MKFYLSVALAATMIAGTANAQKVNLGIKGGLNVYNVKNDNGFEYDSKTGFHAGLLGHIHLAPQFALQPEVMYSSQGAKFTASNTETKLKLGYINVPVMFQYMFDNGFRLQAGPQVGFLINAETETNGASTDVKNNLKTVDFGLGVGVGYVHTASGFGVDARYNLGLSNINESDAVKSTNRGVQVGVFYLFKHK
jgi:hypothetical protein